MNTKKINVSPIIYNNGNRNITTLFDLNIYATKKERRLDMIADLTKVKNLILNDEEAMNYFILIAMFYSTQEEGDEESLEYSDYNFFKFVIDAYNKKDAYIEPFLNKEENASLKRSVEHYYYLFDKKDDILNVYSIDKMLLQYYFLAYFEAVEMHVSIAKMLYLAHKNKGTNFEQIVKNYILSYINHEKYKEGLDLDKKNMTESEYKKAFLYLKKKNYYYKLSTFYHEYREDGELSNTSLLTLVNEIVKDDYYYFRAWEESYNKFMTLFEQSEEMQKHRQDFLIEDTIEKELVRKIKAHCKRLIDDATTYNEIKNKFKDKLEELGKQEGIDTTISEEEVKMLKDKTLKLFKEINTYTLEDANARNTLTDYFSDLAFDDDLKDFLIDNTIAEYTDDRELKEEYKGRYKHLKKEQTKTKRRTKKSKLEHALTEDMIQTSNEWVKVNNSKYSRGILDARDELATYQETDLERQERELKELQENYNKTHDKSILEDIEDKKIDIAENKKKFDALCDDIKEKETELADLRRLYNDADDEGKAEYLKLLKKKDKELKELKKKRDSRGFNTQLDLFSNDLKVENKDVTLSIAYDKFDINNYTSEGKRLLVYMQNQLYYNPTNDYLVIDLDEYLDQTGRKLSTSRVVRKKIETTLKSIYDESYKLHIKDEAEDRELTGQIRLIQEYWQDRYKGKMTYYIKPSDAYRKILLNDKAMKWASIPILLNRLNGTKAEDRAREVGFYLYQTLRSDLKNQKVGHNYNKNFKMKTFTDLLLKKGLNNNYETYAKNIINPLLDALNRLEDLGFIEYHTNAFLEYDGYYNEEKQEQIKGTIGTSENNIKSTFESADILITYKIADYEEYDRIINKRAKKITTKPRKKKEQ